MQNDSINARRRAWLLTLAASGAFGFAGLTTLIRRAQAMASRPYPEGVQEMKGDVRINNKPAKPGAIVNPGDRVTTGVYSYVVFVVGQDAFLLRDRTQLDVSGERATATASGEVKAAVVKALHVLSGKMLSVFGKGEKRIVTPTAVIGVRGTGVYVEAEPKRSYVCTCYGETVLEAKGSRARETVRTSHHESPRYINSMGAIEMIEKAPVINHTDAELTMLESLMGRAPPFAGSEHGRRY